MPHYGTTTGADAYHLASGNTAWSGTEADKAAALTRASAYVDSLALGKRTSGTTYTMFAGTKTGGRDQELAWPRTGAYDADGTDISATSVPYEVVYATYEAALRELTQPGYLSPDYVPAQSIKREKVDVLETEYNAPSADMTNPMQPVTTLVQSMLAPLLVVSATSSSVGVMVV